MQVHCNHCDNQECFINKYISTKWKHKIGDGKMTLEVKKNQQVIFQGSTITGIYFIYSGKVKVFRSDTKDDYQIIRFANSGDVLGHRGYGIDSKYPISASAVADSTLCFINNDLFFQALRENSDLAIALMMFYADELKKAEAKKYIFMKMPVKARIADILVTLQKKYGYQPGSCKILNVQVAKKEIANMAVTSYETALRMLVELSDEKAIQFEGKKLRILDLSALMRVAQSRL